MAGEAKQQSPKTLQDVYDGYAKAAEKNPKQVHEVSLVETFEVEFTEDFGFHTKGSTAKVSKVAYDLYKANGVIK